MSGWHCLMFARGTAWCAIISLRLFNSIVRSARRQLLSPLLVLASYFSMLCYEKQSGVAITDCVRLILLYSMLFDMHIYCVYMYSRISSAFCLCVLQATAHPGNSKGLSNIVVLTAH